MNKRLLILVLVILILAVAVKLICTNLGSKKSIDCSAINFSFPSNSTAGDLVAYSVDSTDGVTSLLWKFGDGKTSKLQQGKHIYDSAGTYYVSVTINGGICTKLDTIQVKGKMRHADFNIICPEQAHVGDRIVFKTDAQGAKTFEWKFGETNAIDSKDPSPTYSYKSPKIYEVTLKTDLGYNFVEKQIKIIAAPVPQGGPKYIPPSKAEIQSWLSSIAAGRVPGPKDNQYVNNNFILGSSTPVTVLQGNTKTNKILSRLFTDFDYNPGKEQIGSVNLIYDQSTNKIASLTVEIK